MPDGVLKHFLKVKRANRLEMNTGFLGVTVCSPWALVSSPIKQAPPPLHVSGINYGHSSPQSRFLASCVPKATPSFLHTYTQNLKIEKIIHISRVKFLPLRDIALILL